MYINFNYFSDRWIEMHLLDIIGTLSKPVSQKWLLVYFILFCFGFANILLSVFTKQISEPLLYNAKTFFFSLN